MFYIQFYYVFAISFRTRFILIETVCCYRVETIKPGFKTFNMYFNLFRMKLAILKELKRVSSASSVSSVHSSELSDLDDLDGVEDEEEKKKIIEEKKEEKQEQKKVVKMFQKAVNKVMKR